MAEVKKEIIEKIFSIDKDNGQTIQLNIIKWGKNSSKHDLRIWDGEKSLKGFTLSEEELKRLCDAMAKKYNTHQERVEVPVGKLSFDVQRMNAIDLRAILDTYPNSFNDYNRFRALLRDKYPKKSLEVNLLLCVLHCGIVGQMVKLKQLKTVDMNRYIAFMEKEYGTMGQYTAGAVMLWAKALDIPCKVKINAQKKEDKAIIPSSAPVQVQPVIGHKFNDLVFENEDIAITYKGVYKFDGLFAQGHRIRFVIENKTNQKMRIEGKNISANGFVIASDDLFNSEVEPHKKVIDTVLMRQSNLSAVGVKQVSDMKELAITFEYEMNRNKKRTTEIFLEPHEVKE